MKLFLLLILFCAAHSSRSQDTTLISRALEFIRTEDFKTAIRAWTNEGIENNIREYPAIRKRASRYRKEELGRMNFWLSAKCYVADTVYFTPDVSSLVAMPGDSLRYRKFNQSTYHDAYLVALMPLFFHLTS